MLQQTDKVFQSAHLPSPRFKVVDDETKFQLSIDVPGVKTEDIDISLEDGYLSVRAQRVVAGGDESSKTRYSSKFSQSFSLDPAVDVEKFTATLDHGVLVVTAPKDLKKIEENIRKIPISSVESSSSPSVAAPAATESSFDEAVTKEDEQDTIDLDQNDGQKEANDEKENDAEESK